MMRIKNLKMLIRLAATLSILGFMLWKVQFRLSDLVTGIDEVRYILVALLIPLTLIPIISINRWKVFLQAIGIQESFFSLWRINWVAMFQGLVLPSAQGFDFLRIYHIERRHPAKRGYAGSTVFVERMIGLVMLCLLSVIALPCVSRSGRYSSLVWIVIAINILTFSGIALLLNKGFLRRYVRFQSNVAWVHRIVRYVASFHDGIARFPYGRTLLSSVCLIACYQLLLVANVMFVFRAYGYPIPFLEHLALYPVIGVLSLVPITIGGFGVREGFFVYFYSLLSVPADIAVSVSITNYVILTFLPACLGGLIYIWDGFHGSSLERPARMVT